MNQILITQKLYITPEIKRKKLIYKLEFLVSVFLICLLFSYYVFAEYDKSKTEQGAKEILAQLKYIEEDNTVMNPEDEPIIVVLSQEQEEKPTEEVIEIPEKVADIDRETYVSTDGVSYTADAILKIPCIDLEYVVLSATSPDLLFVSLNKYWPPWSGPNEIGNYCIVGHYYSSNTMFGYLNRLKNGDRATLTDLSGRTVEYEVYNSYIVEPTDTRCTSQLTNGKRELTLITCTNHGKQRLVVKLREV